MWNVKPSSSNSNTLFWLMWGDTCVYGTGSCSNYSGGIELFCHSCGNKRLAMCLGTPLAVFNMHRAFGASQRPYFDTGSSAARGKIRPWG